MFDQRFRLAVACVLFAAPLAAINAIAQETPPPANANEDPAAAALAAVEDAADALAAWQKAIEDGARVRDEDIAKLKAQLRPLGGRIEWLLDNRKDVQRAARDAEPQYRNTDEQIKAWVEQMRAIGAGAENKRAEVVARLRAALTSDVEDQQYAALRTLQQIGDVKYDKEQFRPLILPFVMNARGHMLVSAAYALFNTKREADDLVRIQQAWERRSPALEGSISHLLFMFGDGKIDGRSEEIMLELLASPDASVRREGLRGLWGANLSGKLIARLVELADDPDSHGDAIYFGLSTLKPKNEAAVDKLIETLTDPDWNNWDRALWGLGYGVPEELQPKVAKALAEMYKARSDPKTRAKCRDLIRQYAGNAAAELLPE
jgi:hypothetical protein